MSLIPRFLRALGSAPVAEPSLASWRAALTDHTFRVIVFGAGLTIFVVTASHWPAPPPVTNWLVILFYALALLLLKLPGSSGPWRAALVLSVFLFVAPFLFASFGPGPSAYLSLLAGCVLAGLLIGPRAATGFIVVSVGFWLLGWWAHFAGLGAGNQHSTHHYPNEYKAWFRTGVVWLSVTCWLVFVNAWLTTRFEHALRGKKLALLDAHEQEAGRLRSEARRDATESALIEAQKHEAMSRIAGGVSHEFNNALFVILGWNDLLSNEGMGQAQRRQGHAAIASAGRSAAELARRLVTMGRQRSGPPHETRLLPLMEEGVRYLARLLPDDIRVSSEPAEVPPVSIDPGQLQQVLLNLALHARDAMPQGGRLGFSLRHVGPELGPPVTAAVGRAGWVVIEMRDTGPGMDEQMRAGLFEAGTDTSGPAPDATLGLAASLAIVTRAGGRIDVESGPGRGTTFRVTLPVATSATEPPPPPPDAAPLQRRASILVVEDDDAVRELIVIALRAHGHRVRAAADGDQALQMLDEPDAHDDLLCVDGILPGAPATAIIERFRVMHPGRPVLVCSGNLGTPQLQALVQRERLPYLPKPFSPHELTAKIDGLLAGLQEPVRT